MKEAEALACAAQILADHGISDPQREARILLRAAVPRPYFDHEVALEDGAEVTLFDLVARRANHEPISHLVGYREFFNHRFLVTADVLDPRPETETLVRAALSEPFEHVLDLGTGSGCILLSLLAARPTAAGLGTELSAAALEVARKNAMRLEVETRCLFLNSSWYQGVEGRFDLIVSNPPYISAEEMRSLKPELSFEPRIALTDEADGLSAYRKIVEGAVRHLCFGGRLMVEIGWQQGEIVRGFFESAGFVAVDVIPDLDGRDRVVCGVFVR